MTRAGGISTEMFLSRADELSTQEKIRAEVWEELRWEPFLDPHDLRVSVEGTSVKLSGVVKSCYERSAAEYSAKRVRHVQLVTNDITVQVPAADRHSDDEIRHKITEMLDWDVRISRDRVTIQVHDGGVSLSGEAASEWERAVIEDTVRTCRGVRAITNLIVVDAVPPKKNLRPEIEAELRRHAELHGDHIRVETHGGEVVLHGTVRSLAEREEAERAARSVPGVTHLEDDIKVRK